MTHAIYMIKNTVNGKFYVGGTTELKKTNPDISSPHIKH